MSFFMILLYSIKSKETFMIDFDNIRLVAADMDGTLLNSKRELPPDLPFQLLG